MTKSRGIRSPRRAWTPRELRLLRELYPDLLAGKVATELGRTVKQVYDMAHKLALGKSDAFKASEAAKLSVRARQRPEIVARHFAKGFTPWNKGLKGLQLGGVATQFKPGNPPHNRGRTATEVLVRRGVRGLGPEFVLGLLGLQLLLDRQRTDRSRHEEKELLHGFTTLNWRSGGGPNRT